MAHTKQLFSQFRWAMFAESRLRCALGEVAALGAEQLASPEGALARIFATPALRIPVLDTETMTVVPTIRKVLTSRFSLTFADERHLAFTLPYSGDAIGFDTCPSLGMHEAIKGSVGEMAISFMVPDDAWAPYAIDRTTCLIMDALEALRADMAANEAAVREAVEAAMLARRHALQTRAAEVVPFRGIRETILPRVSMQELSLAS